MDIISNFDPERMSEILKLLEEYPGVIDTSYGQPNYHPPEVCEFVNHVMKLVLKNDELENGSFPDDPEGLARRLMVVSHHACHLIYDLGRVMQEAGEWVCLEKSRSEVDKEAHLTDDDFDDLLGRKHK